MTIARVASAVATVAIILLTATGCAERSPQPNDVPTRSAPARPTGAPDPTTVAMEATYSAWRRSPVRPTPDFAAMVADACRADAAVGDAPLAVLDVRGEGRAVLVFDAGDAATACVVDTDADGTVTAMAAHPVPGVEGSEPPADGDMGVHEMWVVDASGAAYSVLVGQFGMGGVKDVAANFDADAAWYTAASDNGWYAIWWPGKARPLGVATSNNRSEVIDSYAP